MRGHAGGAALGQLDRFGGDVRAGGGVLDAGLRHERAHAAITGDAAVGQRILSAADEAADVALDGVDAVLGNLLHDAHVVDFPAVLGKEDQVAGHRHIAVVLERAAALEGLRPAGAVGHAREGGGGNIGIAQAEGDEHRAPLVIRRAVDVAVAGIAVAVSVLVDDEIRGALGIADLRAGDVDEVLAPVAGEVHLFDGDLPVIRVLACMHGHRHADRSGGLAADGVAHDDADAVIAAARRDDRKGQVARRVHRHGLLADALAAVLSAQADGERRIAALDAHGDGDAPLARKDGAHARAHADLHVALRHELRLLRLGRRGLGIGCRRLGVVRRRLRVGRRRLGVGRRRLRVSGRRLRVGRRRHGIGRRRLRSGHGRLRLVVAQRRRVARLLLLVFLRIARGRRGHRIGRGGFGRSRLLRRIGLNGRGRSRLRLRHDSGGRGFLRGSLRLDGGGGLLRLSRILLGQNAGAGHEHHGQHADHGDPGCQSALHLCLSPFF